MSGLAKLQAIFRGSKSRSTHIARAKSGCKIICPYYASSDSVVDVMIRLGNISALDIVFDLGSGNGNILINIAMKTNANCIGVDIDSLLCATARRRSKEFKVDHMTDFVINDIASVDFAMATVICMFLVPSCLKELSSKLRIEYERGARIVCYKFGLPESEGWVPNSYESTEDVVNVNDPNARSTVYYYCKNPCL